MKLEGMSDPQLEQMYHNCVASIADAKPNVARARSLLIEINRVWEKRLEMAQSGEYRFQSPDVGMLKRLGYRVGKEGISVEKRRALLKFTLFDTLPFVASPKYMLEWGECPASA